jgi:hypothetical protein
MSEYFGTGPLWTWVKMMIDMILGDKPLIFEVVLSQHSQSNSQYSKRYDIAKTANQLSKNTNCPSGNRFIELCLVT